MSDFFDINDGVQVKDTKAIIQFLSDKRCFYLGGSRGMAKKYPSGICLHKESDWDFYATHSGVLQQSLIDFGFEFTGTTKSYFDSEAVEILEMGIVQVVLRKDAHFYKKVWDTIPLDVYIQYLWKRSPSCNRELIQPFFNMMFEAARLNYVPKA